MFPCKCSKIATFGFNYLEFLQFPLKWNWTTSCASIKKPMHLVSYFYPYNIVSNTTSRKTVMGHKNDGNIIIPIFFATAELWQTELSWTIHFWTLSAYPRRLQHAGCRRSGWAWPPWSPPSRCPAETVNIWTNPPNERTKYAKFQFLKKHLSQLREHNRGK